MMVVIILAHPRLRVRVRTIGTVGLEDRDLVVVASIALIWGGIWIERIVALRAGVIWLSVVVVVMVFGRDDIVIPPIALVGAMG